jgi:CheY-like chemotaxis protein
MDDYLQWTGCIWYADDDAVLRKLAQNSLSRAFPHAQVFVYSGGIPALAAYDDKQNPVPDILLTDYVMDITGGELIRQMRKRAPNLPAAIFTATPAAAEADSRALRVPVFAKEELGKINPGLAKTLYQLATKQ